MTERGGGAGVARRSRPGRSDYYLALGHSASWLHENGVAEVFALTGCPIRQLGYVPVVGP